MAANNEKPVVIYPSTGELADGARVITKEEQAARHLYGVKERAKAKEPVFIACINDNLRAINKELSLIEAGALMRLLSYLKRGGKGKIQTNNKPLKQAEISKVFGKGKDATREILNKLEQVGVVRKEKEGRSNVFYVNEKFHALGSSVNKAKFTKMYQGKMRDIISDLSLSEAGILWLAIPYFHYSTFYLALNADERDETKVRFMDEKTLADEIGVDRSRVNRYVRKLINKGAIMRSETLGVKSYRINPSLMFRQSGFNQHDDYTTAVKRDFEAHARQIAD